MEKHLIDHKILHFHILMSEHIQKRSDKKLLVEANLKLRSKG